MSFIFVENIWIRRVPEVDLDVEREGSTPADPGHCGLEGELIGNKCGFFGDEDGCPE